MTQSPHTAPDRLTAADSLFFTWLIRVMAAALLAGCAWLDDAPPLEVAALLITLYVAVRVVMQFRAFMAAAPFSNSVLKILFAMACLLLLLTGAFMTVVIFTAKLAGSVAGF